MNEHSATVTKRAGIVAAGTMTSRVLGLARESTIAALFPTWAIDAYQVAFMIPNSFRRLTAEGAFSVSLTSVFAKIHAGGSRREARAFVASVYGFALAFLITLSVAGVLLARPLTLAAGYGFAAHPEKFALAVSLLRWMFPYIAFISATAVAMGVLNAAGHFAAPAFAPALLNISILACAFSLRDAALQWGFSEIFALAFGVLLGGVAQLALQIPFLRRAGYLVRPAWDLGNPALRRVLAMTAPMILVAAAYQFFNFLATAFASTLGSGAVTYIAFSQRLFELPLAVLVMAVSTAALPSLSSLVGAGDMEEAKRTWASLVRLTSFVAVPAQVGIMVLARPLVTIMYQRGAFTALDAAQTAAALRWIAAGLCAVGLLRQTTPFFYAIERIKLPAIMTFVMIGVYAAAALLLKDTYGHVGLCMAITAATTVQAAGLLVALRRQVGALHLADIARSFTVHLAAAVPLAGAAWAVSLAGDWDAGGNDLRNVAVLAASVVAGAAVYLLAAAALRCPESRLVTAVLRRLHHQR